MFGKYIKKTLFSAHLQHISVFLTVPVFRFCTVGLLSASLILSGCSLPNFDNSDDDSKFDFPKTSVVTDRENYLSEALKTPEDPQPMETRIIMRLNPQFVLHLGKKHRVLAFEPLNATAKALKKSTKKKWKRKPYQKAVRSILEQCVIDGYISDVSNNISMQVIYTSSGTALDTSGIASAGSIEGDIIQIAEEVTATHGISAEITTSSSDNTSE